MENNATIAFHYTTPGNPTSVNVPLLNYGDTILTINLDQYPRLNGTAYDPPSGTATLQPGEAIEFQIIILNGPIPGEYIDIYVQATYDSNTVTDQLIIPVYSGS